MIDSFDAERRQAFPTWLQTDDRRAEIECVIRGGRFDVTGTWPDRIDPEENWNERRERVVRRHFGDRPIVFPPWPPDDEHRPRGLTGRRLLSTLHSGGTVRHADAGTGGARADTAGPGQRGRWICAGF